MKKKLLSTLICLFVVFACAFVLTACDNSDQLTSIPENNSVVTSVSALPQSNGDTTNVSDSTKPQTSQSGRQSSEDSSSSAHVHNLQFDGFVWNGYTAQAKYSCTGCDDYSMYYAATVTCETATATCTTTGVKTYTATYDGHTDTKTETLAALDHDYIFVGFIWNGFTAQAKYVCSHDSAHVQYYNANVTSETTTPASCTTTGLKTYTAIYDGHTDTKTETLGTSPHNYVNGVCYVCGKSEWTEGLIYTLNDDGESYSVTGIGTTATKTNIIIPSSYNGKPVTSIGKSAFSGLCGLTSITIPDSITNISSYAFYYCSGLTSITIPDNVTSIGSYAFSGCSSLESITIPFVGAKAGVTSNDTYQYPFGYIFGESSYTGSTTTTQYYYGSSTSSKTNTTYYIPMSLKSVIVTGGNILYGAFYNCRGLTSVTIGNGVMSIGEYAFYFCNVTSVAICDGVTSIDNYGFFGCSGFTSITIPDSVTNIGYSAFEYCDSLTSITIGDGVTSIGERAFYSCSGLTSVYYTGTIDKWCEISFGGYYANPLCFSKKLYINNELVTEANITTATTISAYAFINYTNLTSVIIGNSVTNIGKFAFSGLSGLTSITIPDSVTSIGEDAFSGCSSLESITIPFIGAKAGVTSTDAYQYPFGYIFGKLSYIGSTVTKQYYYGSNMSLTTSTIYYIPTNLKSVTITGENLLYGAFYNCKNLTNVTIDNSVTSIGNSAFLNCSSLTSVTIGNGVTSIGNSAFTYCNDLSKVYYNGSADDWDIITIGYNNQPLTNATIYYYSDTEPELNDEGTEYDGKYWHYVNGEVVVWKKQN